MIFRYRLYNEKEPVFKTYIDIIIIVLIEGNTSHLFSTFHLVLIEENFFWFLKIKNSSFNLI
jgi:hypothetical protein